jgi:hypothetical protein
MIFDCRLWIADCGGMETCVQITAARREGENGSMDLILEQMFSFGKGWGAPDQGFSNLEGQAGKTLQVSCSSETCSVFFLIMDRYQNILHFWHGAAKLSQNACHPTACHSG